MFTLKCFLHMKLCTSYHNPSMHASIVGSQLVIQHRYLSLCWENIPDTVQQNVFHGGFWKEVEKCCRENLPHLGTDKVNWKEYTLWCMMSHESRVKNDVDKISYWKEGIFIEFILDPDLMRTQRKNIILRPLKTKHWTLNCKIFDWNRNIQTTTKG